MVAGQKRGSVISEAILFWAWWQALKSAFASVFTRPGWVRGVQWIVGMVVRWEEHTLTQILKALGLESRWRVLERFAESGAWDRAAVDRQTWRLFEEDAVKATERAPRLSTGLIDDVSGRGVRALKIGALLRVSSGGPGPNRDDVSCRSDTGAPGSGAGGPTTGKRQRAPQTLAGLLGPPL
jgi:hypothetical protein